MIDTIMYNKKEYSLVPKNCFSARFPPGVFRSAIAKSRSDLDQNLAYFSTKKGGMFSNTTSKGWNRIVKNIKFSTELFPIYEIISYIGNLEISYLGNSTARIY